MTEEIWRPVVGWEEMYEISNRGNMRSIRYTIHDQRGRTFTRKPRARTPFRDKDGYLKMCMARGGSKQNLFVHRLVAMAFLTETYAPGLQVNHKDGNPANNTVSNLEWVSQSENMRHAYKTGLQAPSRGEVNGRHKLTETEVIAIRKDRRLQKVIAAEYGVHRGCVSLIKRKVNWKHVA